MQQKTTKRIIASFILVCVVVTFVTSIVFTLHNVNHDCIGEHCPICVQIHNCSDNLLKLGSGITSSANSIILLISLCSLLVLAGAYLDKNNTLFAQKIRLNI